MSRPARRRGGSTRLVVALGGNAMLGPGGHATPQAQQAAVEPAMERLAEAAEGKAGTVVEADR
jgi:carbamate kinase